jgi:hypothetical protein
MRTDVNALQASYDANKVLTSVANGTGGNYTANDLFIALTNVIDTQLGGLTAGGGSVSASITAVQDELQAKIDAINNTVFQDRVKLTGTLSPTGVLTIDPSTVPGLDNTQAYDVYYLSNDAVEDGTGQALTYNFATQTCSGIPSIVNPNNTSGVVSYQAIAAPVQVKVFPVGSFTFSSLQPDFLLNNEELNLVVYQDAIDQIVTDLSANANLVNQIMALVGTQTVQNQIQIITNALAARVSVLEADMALVQGSAATTGSIAQQVKTASDALTAALNTEVSRAESAELALTNTVAANAVSATTSLNNEIQNRTDVVANEAAARQAADTAEANARIAVISQEISDRTAAVNAEAAARLAADNTETAARIAADNAISATVEANRKTAYDADQDRQVAIAQINAVSDVADVIVAVDNQVAFTMSQVANTTLVQLFINGVRYSEGPYFTVDRVNKIATWVFTGANGGFDIVAGYDVQLVYKQTAAVAAPAYI